MTSSIDRRTFLAAVTASVPAIIAARAAGQDQDNQTIVRLMNEFVDAERRYDKTVVSRMLDNEFIYVGNDASLPAAPISTGSQTK